MKNITSSFWVWIKDHKVWAGVIVIVVVSLGFYLTLGGQRENTNTFILAKIGAVRQEVSVTGNVKPLAKASLAFERSGKIVNLNVAVGDRVYAGQILGSVSNADLLANLDQAKANLKKAQAGLGDTVRQSTLSLAQAEISLANTIKDSYTKADDAVRNKIYSLFNDPIKYQAKLAFTTDSFLQEDIEDGKDDLSDALDAWYRIFNRTDIEKDLESNFILAKNNLLAVKSLLDKCAEAVNGLSADPSDVSQTQIDTWKLNISTARTNVNTAVDTLVSSYDAYTTADLTNKVAGNSILAEEAGVEQAQATVKSAEAELNKSFIRSPINGVATKVEVELGEMVTAGRSVIEVISVGDYEIEAFVPEADAAKIAIGNLAKTTLDAFGDTLIFETQVVKIDPSATIIDGVPTYKIVLSFTKSDERIKSGMTANLDILTAEKVGVLIIPTRTVYNRDGNRYVSLLVGENSVTEAEVKVGLRGSDGQIEILSGLSEGDKVVTNQ